MNKSILVLAIMLPFLAGAQKETFLREFNDINDWFFQQNRMKIEQSYTYFNNSTNSPVIDATTCLIVRNETSLHYILKQAELFSDSGFIVRMNHESKDIIVSKSPNTDSNTLKMLLNQGFTNFTGFLKVKAENNLSCWELSGGYGVSSAKLCMDINRHQIVFIELTLDENHPLVNVYGKPNDEGLSKIVIHIDYHYSAMVEQADLVHLSDFIYIDQDMVSTAPKFKNYTIEILNQSP